jgi:hypothetical protein
MIFQRALFLQGKSFSLALNYLNNILINKIFTVTRENRADFNTQSFLSSTCYSKIAFFLFGSTKSMHNSFSVSLPLNVYLISTTKLINLHSFKLKKLHNRVL